MTWDTEEGYCDRCDRPGWLVDGLCRTCREDPALTTEPVTVRATQCEVCGKEATRRTCPRCEESFVEEMERQHERWSA
jgi:predicted amidophosphoribosyltransferase